VTCCEGQTCSASVPQFRLLAVVSPSCVGGRIGHAPMRVNGTLNGSQKSFLRPRCDARECASNVCKNEQKLFPSHCSGWRWARCNIKDVVVERCEMLAANVWPLHRKKVCNISDEAFNE
jgi:hypothetical protein